jgi:hypothetical protein
MSGFPLKSPADASKYRQIYMATLGLQAANDEKNLVANQLFKKTGEVPVQPPDTRTTAQKYMDIISLKNGALGALAKIMDGDQVRRAIAQMTRGEVAFYLNYSPAINNDILSKMKLGITADTFIPYLRKYMRKELDTQGVNYGLQQETGDRLLLSSQQIGNDMLTRADLAAVHHAVGAGLGGGAFPQQAQLIQDVQELYNALPQEQEVIQLYEAASADGREDMWRELTAYYDQLPRKEDVGRALQNLHVAEQANDARAINDALDTLRQLMAIRPSTLNGFQNVRRRLAEIIADGMGRGMSAEEVEGGYYSMAEAPEDDDNDYGITPVSTSASSIGSIGHALSGILSSGSSFFGVGGGTSVASTQPQGGLALTNPVQIHPTAGYSSAASTTAEDTSPRLSAPAGQQLTSQLKDLKIEPLSYYERRTPQQNAAIAKAWITLERILNEQQGLAQDENDHFEELVGQYDPKEDEEWQEFWSDSDVRRTMNDLVGQRVSIHGKGLKRGRKPRISGSGVKPTKVAPIERYGRIGNHIIKLQPLEKNILTINTPNGWAVKGLPSKTISSNLVNVFKEIVGEGVPKYSSIEDLTEGEKDFLNKIARITKIEDRVKVKTPTKTDLDKLVNRFEILKGEICAGNNSNELVKEFKKIIMTLSNEGMLPKGQAREILMDLVSLGF